MSLAGGRRCTSTIVGIVVRLVGRGRTVNSYIKYIYYIFYILIRDCSGEMMT